MSSNIHENNLSETLRKDLDFKDIIVSGDLTWKADPTEFENCKRFLDDVKSWATLSADQIVLCPGNHDVAFSKEPWKKDAPIDVAPEQAVSNFAEFYQKVFFLRPNEFLCSGRRFLIGNGIVVEVASLNTSLLGQI